MITLAYADALDLLLLPGWPVQIVDMVLDEMTRNQTPTSQLIGAWISAHQLPVVATRTHRHYLQAQETPAMAEIKRANLRELAIQEAMSDFALAKPSQMGIFLFEDHKIARASFMLPENCRKVSTRAFLIFLEEKGSLPSAVEIERKAILNGRNFSQLRFPPV
ncbi:MAG: hypothetical protein EXR30_00505 [Betaproteobacteria bacterium]|nr:hypothetical protein [Betaproteobacteria bacterium]MSQ87895.1 hypothetical protein [Betaproteobacteria bacterium]